MSPSGKWEDGWLSKWQVSEVKSVGLGLPQASGQYRRAGSLSMRDAVHCSRAQWGSREGTAQLGAVERTGTCHTHSHSHTRTVKQKKRRSDLRPRCPVWQPLAQCGDGGFDSDDPANSRKRSLARCDESEEGCEGEWLSSHPVYTYSTVRVRNFPHVAPTVCLAWVPLCHSDTDTAFSVRGAASS